MYMKIHMAWIQLQVPDTICVGKFSKNFHCGYIKLIKEYFFSHDIFFSNAVCIAIMLESTPKTHVAQ